MFDKIRQQMSPEGKQSIDVRAQHDGCLSMAESIEMVLLVVVVDCH